MAVAIAGTTAATAEVTMPGTVISSRDPAKPMEKAMEQSNAQTAASVEAAKQASIKAKETTIAKTTSRRAAVARSKSIYTSPMGISSEADVAKKTLLGQ